MADDLNAFLDGKAEEEPQAAPEAPPAEAPAPEAPAPETKPEAEPEAEGEPDSPTGIHAALAAEREKRRDWKEKAIRAEGEMAELRRQLEAARQPPPAPPEQRQSPPPIDPSVDPQGFVERMQQVVLNERLNTSEMMLRRELGAEKVDAAIAEFKTAAQADPSLFPKLYSQPDPYGWMAKQVEIMRVQKEIGEDPAAYKARLRAEWEAERAAAPPPPEQPLSTAPPRFSSAPSLANARSAAPRGAASFTGPPSLNDVFPS